MKVQIGVTKTKTGFIARVPFSDEIFIGVTAQEAINSAKLYIDLNIVSDLDAFIRKVTAHKFGPTKRFIQVHEYEVSKRNMSLNKTVYDLRQKTGLTKEEFANVCGVPYATYLKMERTYSCSPKLRKCYLILFDVVSTLFSNKDKITNKEINALVTKLQKNKKGN